MTDAPVCFYCDSGDHDFPCRRGGTFDIETLASAYFEHVLWDASANGEGGAHWSYSCAFEIAHDHPRLAWDLVLSILPKLESTADAAHFAAGLLEDLIEQHGDELIADIEALAARSDRFKVVLTGVWPQGRRDTETWKRVEAARSGAGHVDDEMDLPPS